MRRKRQIDGKKMTVRQNIRFADDELLLLQAAARKRKLSVSNFVADVAVEEAERVMRSEEDSPKARRK